MLQLVTPTSCPTSGRVRGATRSTSTSRLRRSFRNLAVAGEQSLSSSTAAKSTCTTTVECVIIEINAALVGVVEMLRSFQTWKASNSHRRDSRLESNCHHYFRTTTIDPISLAFENQNK